MFALKIKLKLNKVEASQMCGNAGFKRFVYNLAQDLLQLSWGWEDIRANDNKRLDVIKKVFTQVTMQKL
ncbi:hypothetical protein [Nostoc sp.]|uniref:hypothetical protein n=1 Tax=Nostoc sp. TaxID=1180 RepID=UPI002FF9C415